MSLDLREHRTDARRRPFVLVTGGKGGVGKTTVAANLGVQLAREGARPLLVDLDLGLADLGLMLGLEPGPSLADHLEEGRELEACLASGPGGVRVLPAASGDPRMAAADPARRERLLSLIKDVPVADTDLAIGDSAAGIGPDVLGFAVAADRVLLVTTPDPAALTDAYGVVKALDLHGREQGTEVPTPELFVNLATDAREAREIAARLRSVCERFLARSPRLAGWMPRSRHVTDAVAAQRAFVAQDGPASARSLPVRCMRQLAARFSELGTAGSRTPGTAAPAPKAFSGHVR